MVAASRFVEFSVTAPTFATGSSADADAVCKGSRGFSRGTGLSNADSFTIVRNSNDTMRISINAVGTHDIVLTSGTDLDPRFVARDIEFRIHEFETSDDNWQFAQCNWRNGSNGISPTGANTDSSFVIYTGKLGNNSGTNKVLVTAPGSFSALTTLGFDSTSEIAGSDFSTLGGSYAGDLTVSGSYGGQFDDHYTLMISDTEPVGDAAANGSPTYNASNITTGGLYHTATSTTYTLAIDTSNGSTMGAGTTNVPEMSWTASPAADDGGPVELLYEVNWYDVGLLGVRVKFADAVFGNNDQFDIICSGTGAIGGGGAPGAATYIWDSYLGDSSKAFSISPKTSSIASPEQVGTRGVTVSFENTSTLVKGETYQITCRGPQPLTEPVTQLNFGNVTVSTNSPVSVVWFEIIGGAVSMSTVKYSLQSDGTFQHHDQGDNDTQFYFGSAGGGNNAPGSGATENNQVEFSVDGNSLGNILATDIDSDSAPTYLNATKADLAVVSSADNAESIGNYQGSLVSDFIWLGIRLGANETGANSTINYRMFFDFS